MRIYLSADIEGVTGSVHWHETLPDKADYPYFQKQMTKEVVAACEGALAAGADEVLVKDAHNTARNIIPSMLPEKTKLFRGWPDSPEMMVDGIGGGFDGAIFIGYHSPSGSQESPLSHTMSLKVHHITCNGKIISEFDINALIAAQYNVPVYFVSGDCGLCELVRSVNPNIMTVATNEGHGSGAICIHPDTAVKRIRELVEQALKQPDPACLYPVPSNYDIEICYKEHALATKASNYPGVKRIDGTTVAFSSSSFKDVLNAFYWIL